MPPELGLAQIALAYQGANINEKEKQGSWGAALLSPDSSRASCPLLTDGHRIVYLLLVSALTKLHP